MKLFFTTVSLLLSFSAIAQENIVTDRPTQGASPFTVSPRRLQIESGILFQRTALSKTVSQHRLAVPSSLFRLGLWEGLELRLVHEVASYKTVNNLHHKELGSVSGTEDIQAGLKYQLSDGTKKFNYGTALHTIWPTGSRGISNRKYGVDARLLLLYAISDNAGISANVGYKNMALRFEERALVRDSDGTLFYTLAYNYSLNEKLGLYAELYTDYVEWKVWESNVDVGGTYLLTNKLQIDYSFGFGVDQVMNYYSLGVSILIGD
jgi:hypothetical protein